MFLTDPERDASGNTSKALDKSYTVG